MNPIRLPRAVLLASTLALAATAGARAEGIFDPPIELGVLAVLSDGDQDAMSYSSGRLADPAREDLMTLWTAPFDPAAGPAGRIEAGNSNFSPSGIAVVAADGRRAYVVETMRRPDGGTELSELVSSDRLLAFDIADPTQPREVADVQIGPTPRSLDLSPDGRTLVAITRDAEAPLRFVPVGEEGVGTVSSFAVPGAPAGFDDYTFVQWSPQADLVAVHLAAESKVAFLRVVRAQDGTVTGVEPHGAPILTNKYPLVGRFTPDGRHYISSDLNWGADVRGFSQVRKGILTLIRVGGGEESPLVTDLDIAGLSAESLAISPDGEFVVASNIETTSTPPGHPRHNGLARLTLYRIDAEHSNLSKVGETQYQAKLPQGIVFDAAGRYVLVGVNELPDDPSRGGVLVFRLDRTPDPRLVDTGRYLEAAPGVHSLSASSAPAPGAEPAGLGR